VHISRGRAHLACGPGRGTGHDGGVSTVIALSLVGSQVGGGWGKAQRIAIATVEDGAVTGWVEHDVRWDIAHDEATEGSHHARVVRFLRDNDVQVVATGHMGPPMARMLGTMGIRAVVDAAGDPREVALTAAQQ
jgi:predicted Fe-Mo cluster-binding NifX family protein